MSSHSIAIRLRHRIHRSLTPACCADTDMGKHREKLARDIAFVLRCSGAATLSYLAALAVGLPHPVWAAMSGVIVGQEQLGETRQATVGRLVGTLLGVAVAVLVGGLTAPLGTGVAIQIALAVALCAVAARRYPVIRVCMWTSPIVFLMADPATPLIVVGLYRGTEVLLGGTIGAMLHVIAEAVIRRIVHHDRA
jgi:uncharacterized membrane protein YccC